MLVYKNKQINIKLSNYEKQLIEEKAKIYNFSSISEYLRFVALNCNIITACNDTRELNKNEG